MRSFAFLVVPGLLVAASSASANNLGIFGKSGRDAEQGTCLQCHFPDNDPGLPPTVTIKGLDGLVTGGVAKLTITVARADDKAGIPEAACPDRCAGFGAAIDGGGAFVIPDGSPVQVNAARDQIAHIAKSPFVDGKVDYQVELHGLLEGEHNLYISANDVDGQEFTGDRVTSLVLPFTVDPPPPPADEGGCAQAGTPVPFFALAALLGLVALRRRRRWGQAPSWLLALALVAVAGAAHAGEGAAAAAPAKPADPNAKANNNMDNCPMALVGVSTQVKDVDGGVELSITGAPDAVKVIRARAKILVDASRSAVKVPKHDGKGDGGGRTGRCPVVMFRTSVTAKDIDGGTALTVKADAPADVAWLRDETRARLDDETEATAGHGKMAHCPSALDGALTKVTDTKDGVLVKITGDAKAIRARTKELLAAAGKPEVASGHGGNGNGGGGYGRCPVVVKGTKLSAKDVDGGTEITVAAAAQGDVAALQKEAHRRAERLAGPK